MYVYIYMYICIYIYVYYIYIYLFICIYIYIYLFMNMIIYIYIIYEYHVLIDLIDDFTDAYCMVNPWLVCFFCFRPQVDSPVELLDPWERNGKGQIRQIFCKIILIINMIQYVLTILIWMMARL